MPEFIVRMARLSVIEFAIDAQDEADAKARYLTDGEEITNKTEKQVAYKVLTRKEYDHAKPRA